MTRAISRFFAKAASSSAWSCVCLQKPRLDVAY